MIPNFAVVDVSYDKGKPSIKTIIVDDDKYVGFIFTYQDIELHPAADGIGVSYDLVVDRNKDAPNTVFFERDIQDLKDTAHLIIEKIMTDMVDSINAGPLDTEEAR